MSPKPVFFDDQFSDDDTPLMSVTLPTDPRQIYRVAIPVDRLEKLRLLAVAAGQEPAEHLETLAVSYIDNA